ncbi:MAG: glycosyltransferase family 4 protein [Flavobacteriales bacterium]|nr:glycosyltransferase family 4 protein [Flavobacteriales bacterium]
MKIAQIAHIYLPHIGGIEAYVSRLAKSLKDKGEDCTVLTTSFNTNKKGRKQEAIYFRPLISVFRNPLAFGLVPHLIRNNYDVIHLHSVWFLHSLIGAMFKRNSRLITSIHGVYPDYSSKLLRLFLSLFQPIVKYILRRSDAVIVYSEIEKKKLHDRFHIDRRKVHIIPMGVYPAKEIGVKRNKEILFTGRIIPDKNPELLIQALSMVNSEFPEFKINFVGLITEHYKKQLIQLSNELGISNTLLFHGPYDPGDPAEFKELMLHYSIASVFVAVGSWEGQPTRLMEAMIHGIPVIAFAAGGTADFIRDGENGLLIHKLEAEQLAIALRRILGHPEEAKSLGMAGRKQIESVHNWEKVVNDIQKIYINGSNV